MELWNGALPTNRGEPVVIADSSFGKVLYYPQDKAGLTLAFFPDAPAPVRMRGGLKRLLLLLIGAAGAKSESDGFPKRQSLN